MTFRCKIYTEKVKRERFQKRECGHNFLKSLATNNLLDAEFRELVGKKINLRQGSSVRIKNRCVITNRAKSVVRFFRLSRIQLRDMPVTVYF